MFPGSMGGGEERQRSFISGKKGETAILELRGKKDCIILGNFWGVGKKKKGEKKKGGFPQVHLRTTGKETAERAGSSQERKNTYFE